MYWIFGAGDIGKKIYSIIDCERVAGYIDNDKKKIHTQIDGITIFSLSEALEIIDGDYISNTIVIASIYIYDIQKQLEAHGVKECIGYDEIFLMHKLEMLKSYYKTVDDADIKIELDRREHSKVDAHMISSIVLFGYNVDVDNLGCRATSEALRELIEQKYSITRKVKRNELLNEWPEAKGSIYEYIAHTFANCGNKISRLKEILLSADAVIINGEGSFIFVNDCRDDLYVFCLLMYLCIVNNKPFYLLNMMISGGYEETINNVQMLQALSLISYAQKVCVRDLYSLSLIDNDLDNVSFVPDALFSKYDYYSSIDVSKKTSIMKKNGIISEKYIVMSGNSEAAGKKVKAIASYKRLYQALKNEFGDSYQIVIMECCSGDFFLKDLACDYGVSFIPANAEIDEMAIILQNASVFISGRYHPSIMAYLGGTPCIFTESNSHKTHSLMDIMNEHDYVFPAYLSEEDCTKIVNNTKMKLIEANREALISRVSELCAISRLVTVDM